MAVYRLNPGDLTTGAGVPTGLTSRWHAAGVTISVAVDSGSPSGKAIRLDMGAASTRVFLSIDAVNADANRATCDVICLVRLNTELTVEASNSGLGARVAGDDATETGMIAAIGTTGATGEDIRTLDYNAGASPTATRSGDINWVAGTRYWLRLTVDNTNTVARLYALNDPLGTPMGTVTVASRAANATDWIGLFAFAANIITDYLYVGIGTNADTAPLPLDPALTSPTGTQTGATTANLSVSVPWVSGTIYRVVTTSATAPSVAQIQAGQDHTGAAAVASGNAVPTASGVQNYSVTGLTASTGYYAHFQWRDAISDDSAVVTSALFTTAVSGGLVLRNSLRFFADGAETTPTNDTGVTVVVYTPGVSPVIQGRYTADIVQGYVNISDTPFDTAAEAFKMALEKGTFSRVVDGTVVSN